MFGLKLPDYIPKWAVLTFAVCAGAVGGYFCPKGPVEMAAEAYLQTEGINVDFSQLAPGATSSVADQDPTTIITP